MPKTDQWYAYVLFVLFIVFNIDCFEIPELEIYKTMIL